MSVETTTGRRARREDILVSVCLAESQDGAMREAELSELASGLSERFRYWEILLVSAAGPDGDIAIPNIPNLRIIKVTPRTDFYRRREIAASEAIGDVMVLSAFSELLAADPVALAEAAWEGQTAIVAERNGRGGLLEPVLGALGRSGGFRASAVAMQSLALPRALLGLVMSYPDRQLALRFLPRDQGIPVKAWKCPNKRAPRRLSDLSRRLGLLQSLLSHSASGVLTIVAVIAAFTAVGALGYLVYVIAVWIALDTLAEGWLTLSLSIGGSTLFLAVVIFGLSIGLGRVIDLLSVQDRDDVIGETNALDLFADLARELNVTVEGEVPSEPVVPATERD